MWIVAQRETCLRQSETARHAASAHSFTQLKKAGRGILCDSQRFPQLNIYFWIYIKLLMKRFQVPMTHSI